MIGLGLGRADLGSVNRTSRCRKDAQRELRV